MQIKQGSFYPTRDGKRAGPMVDRGEYFIDSSSGWHYAPDGRCAYHGRVDDEDQQDVKYRRPHDIVSEGPVRIVTRKEIVPGRYGNMFVDNSRDGLVFVRWAPSNNATLPFTAAEARTLAGHLTEIADALDEQAAK